METKVGDTTKLDGYKKILYLVLGVLGTAGLNAVNDPAAKEAASQAITLATNLVPVITGVIGAIVQGFVDLSKVKAEGKINEKVEVIKATTEAEVIKATTEAKKVEKPLEWNLPTTDEGWDKWKAQVKSDIDQENADWLNKDIGNPRLWITPEQAKAMKPELSSDNPAMVWSKTQIRLMDTMRGNVMSNAEAIAAYEKALLPAAEAACKDAADQSTLVEGVAVKICKWPASPMCKMWRAWCLENLESLKAVDAKKIFDFKGYPAWYAGEVATSWVRGLSPVSTTYIEGKQINKYFKDF